MIFNHYIAIPNPIYEVNLGDLRRTFPEKDFKGDKQFDFVENGFLYKFAGQVWAIFQGNNKKFADISSGLYGQSGAFATFNRYYRSSNKYVSLAEYDKLIPCISGKEFFSVNHEKTQVNLTGINRLQFKATEIEMVVDSSGRIYYEGIEFNLVDGYIKWIDNTDRPSLDPNSGKGRVMSVRYRYKPTFYVKMLAHDIRMHAALDSQGEPSYAIETLPNGDIQYKPGPISANLVADFVFLDQRTNDDERVDAQILEDEDNGNLGPR
jgi:hypothetical protein